MAAWVRVSVQGTMAGNEEWSTNPVFSVGNGTEPPVSASQAATIAAAVAAIVPPAGLLSMMAGNSNISSYRLEFRNSDGTLEQLAEASRASSAAGTGTVTHPHQIAMVTSLMTNFAGPRGRGRLYWPANGLPLQSTDARPAAATVTSILAGVKTFLSSINSAITATIPGGNLVVWSRSGSPAGGALHAVTSLRMGNVLDTQRRRRDNLIEGYTSTSWP